MNTEQDTKHKPRKGGNLKMEITDKIIQEGGVRKMLWFNIKQIKQLDEIRKLTNDSNSTIVRIALDKYLESLKG
jgi:hypothetical protein